MLPQLTDTVVCNPELLNRFQSDENFNYARELEMPEVNIWEWLQQQVGELLRDLFSIKSTGDIRIFIYIVLALVLIGGLIFLLFKYKPKLFRSEGRIKTDSIEANDIYGVDFEEELRKAFERADFSRAVCVVYLQTLRRLADANLISWKIYKTPTQYTREYLHPEFVRFTTLFMRVRYGNYMAVETDVQNMQTMQTAIEEGGVQ